MALALNDRVQQQGTANTTVSFTLTSTVPGFQTFAVIGNGNTTYYAATDASFNWEVGIGTYSTSGPTLTRTTILSSSNSGSAETFVGDVNVFVTYPSEKSINYDGAGVATIGELLGYADTGIIASFASTVAGYNQVVVQNKSTATNASSNLNVSNDAGTASANYAELGINSSTFSNGAGCFNIPGAAYVASAGEDLSIGTYGPHSIHFATNSNTTDSMTIYDDGGTSLGGYGNPGLGSMAGNKFVPGYTPITSAAGITVLTSASTYYQQIVGTATQTIQMPDATTLLQGTSFIIANNSTQDVTITDGATVTFDTTVPGSLTYLFLSSNATVAGTWQRYHFLPTSYDFGATSANFGAATISNAIWNGTAIGTAYGGTGLTTFTAANNALYSTSAGALAAGTLPVAAGGTSATTQQGAIDALAGAVTSGYYLRGNGTNVAMSAIQVADVPTLNQDTTGTAAKTNALNSATTVVNVSSATAPSAGQVLTATSGTAATWQTPGGGFPSGTAMLFVQTAAPTGWTKSVTHDNKALRIVSGTAGTGGSVAFTTAFASQAVTGSVAATAVATATNQATTAGGSISVTVGAGTLAVGAGTFAVGATTISTAQMPSHTHPDVVSSINNAAGTSSKAGGNNQGFSVTGATGSGGSHTHGLTGAPSISGSPSVTSSSFTGTSHNHTQNAHSHTSGAFTGTAIDLAVSYVDVIIATKD